MSKAIRCDRCGKCFDPETLGDVRVYCHFLSPSLVNGTDAKKNCVTRHFRDSDGKELLSVDLCADCTDMFIDFMEHKKE